MMIYRNALIEADQRRGEIPAVAILGPRQAGKTTLAHQLAENRPSLHLDLQVDEDRARLSDPAVYLQRALSRHPSLR